MEKYDGRVAAYHYKKSGQKLPPEENTWWFLFLMIRSSLSFAVDLAGAGSTSSIILLLPVDGWLPLLHDFRPRGTPSTIFTNMFSFSYLKNPPHTAPTIIEITELFSLIT